MGFSCPIEGQKSYNMKRLFLIRSWELCCLKLSRIRIFCRQINRRLLHLHKRKGVQLTGYINLALTNISSFPEPWTIYQKFRIFHSQPWYCRNFLFLGPFFFVFSEPSRSIEYLLQFFLQNVNERWVPTSKFLWNEIFRPF